MKRITTKIMQIDNKEFQKCKSGQEFKAKFISHSGPSEPPKPPRPTLATVIKMIAAMQDTLKKHGEAIAGVKSDIVNINNRMDRNKLKS
jgi:hypothetical protein